MSIRFCKGDRVICNNPPSGELWLDGQHGTVCRDQSNDSNVVKIRWDIPLLKMSNGETFGHDCGGCCDIGYGWNTSCYRLIYEYDYEDNQNKILNDNGIDDVL